jgi:hypothetical protein
MNYRLVEIVSREIIDNESFMIIECNEYSHKKDNLINQLSRSPFRFPVEMTDSEIIEYLKMNEYSIYFPQ